MRPASSRLALGALALLTLLLAFAGADVMSLKGCDEGFYAQIAREMLQRADWVTPHYAGAVNFEKPPLLFWLVASAYALLGVGDLQARLPVLVAGILGVGLSAYAAWVLRRDGRNAVIAGGVVATTGLYIQVWHQVMIDVPAFVTLVLLALGLLGEQRDRRFGWLVGPSLGLLILAKGALAALVMAACLPYLLWRRPRPTKPLVFGLFVGLVPALAWYGAMHQLHGVEFWRIHLWQQVFQRAQSGLFAKDPLGPAFYVVHMLGTFLPWSFLIPGALTVAWRRARAGDGPAVFSLGFFGVFLVVISLMQTKFEHYALPLLLPVALMVADWATEPAHRTDRLTGGLYVFLSLLLAGAIAAIKVFHVPVEVPQLDGTLLAVSLLATTLAWGGALLVCRASRPSVTRTIFAGTALSFVVAAQLLHPWDAMPGLRQVAAAVPAEAAVHLVIPGGSGADFCTYAAARYRVGGALDVLVPDQVPAGPKGWYLGKAEFLTAVSGDRLVLEAGGWRILERR
ncbi:MAG TPA: glycosyltransferase family 39 protein [Stenomitos sp.]